ncbi:MAG: N-acetylmuramoyl-L-alanine amidase [Lachnospiraceae bacterium]
MPYKIVIDAGHGGEDPGAVYRGRQEKDDNLRLAMAVGQILENRGVDVVYTRTGDVYQTPFEKATIGNEANADFFISFHRNSSPRSNQYSGVETLVYDKSGEKLELAENINGALGELGYQNLGVKARPGLVVLRRTKMPAVLIETGFINTDADNQLFDQKFDQTAQAIADAVLGTLGEEEVEQEPQLYRVQVGLFRVKQNADNLLYELLDKGYPAFMLYEDGFYKVQVGAYRVLGNAVKMERQLRQAGYDTWITT